MIRRSLPVFAVAAVGLVAACFGTSQPVVAKPTETDRVVVMTPTGAGNELEYSVNIVDLATDRITFRLSANGRNLAQYFPRNRGAGCTMDPCPTLSVVMPAVSSPDGGYGPA